MNTKRHVSQVWNHYKPDKNEKKFAICNHCKASVSRGSDIPSKQTTKTMQRHLERQHPEVLECSEIDSESETPSENPSEAQNKTSNLKRPASGDSDCVRLFNLRSKKDRKTMLCHTIPGWIASTNKYEFNSQKAQSLHKSVFEMVVLDCQPFTFVNDPGMFIKSID